MGRKPECIRRAEWDNLHRDFERFARGSTLAGRAEQRWAYWTSPQYRTLLFYRLWRTINLPVIRWLLYQCYRRCSLRSGIELSAPIGGGVVLPHWGRIVIDAQSTGQDLYCLHNVTVGTDFATGRPTIGNDVFIGTGAIVIGNIRIGDHVVIAAGSLVRADVPACSLVAGNPARVIRSITPDTIHAMTNY